MDRRKVIAAVGIGISAPGCLGSRHHGGIDTSVPPELEGLSFERLEQSDVAVDPEVEPVVRVDSDGEHVAVEGNVFAGSSQCNQAKLESISFDRVDSVIRFVVTPGKSPEHPDYSLLGSSCTEDLSPDAYRIESPIPTDIDRIEVIERDFDDRTQIVGTEVA